MSDQYLLLIIEGEWDSASVSEADYAQAMQGHGAFSAAVAAAGAKVLGGEALQSMSAGFSVTPGLFHSRLNGERPWQGSLV